MKSLAHDIFLLMGQLFQLHSRDKIISIFIESINELMNEFSIAQEQVGSYSFKIEVGTKNKIYYHIYANVDPLEISCEFSMILYNAVQMLAVILEKLAYEQLLDNKAHESEAKYRNYVDNSPIAIFVTNQKGQYIDVNAAAINLLGYSKQEILEKNIKDIEYEPDVESFLKLKEIGKIRQEVTLRTKTGEKVDVDLSAVKLTNHQYIAYCNNITDKKRLEGQLQQSQKLESIGNLAAGIAHDFNNLLTVIIGNSDLVRLKLKSHDELKDLLDDVINASEKASELTQKMLLFSRKGAMNFSPVNINECITDLKNILQRIIGENITIQTDLAQDIDLVKADQNNIEQVILNIAANARDAMPNGGNLSISTKNVTITNKNQSIISHSVPGKYIVMSIEDEGIGMAQGIVNKIFDPFFTTKEVGKGTGMGLSVVYGIVKKHNGWINVYSEPGQGTAFKVYLPALKMNSSNTQTRGTNGNVFDKVRNESILVIEDNPAVLKFVANLLIEYGYMIEIAQNCKEAVMIMERKNYDFDLIISDVILPDGNGVDLINEFRKIKENLRVLMISGYAGTRAREKIAGDGHIFFLSKPFSNEELLKKIDEVFEN